MIAKLPNAVKDMNVSDAETAKDKCDVCLASKQTKLPFGKSERRAVKPLELVHSDVLGPVEPITSEGHRYAVSFIDDYSRLMKIYTMPRKSDTLDKFCLYRQEMENENKKVGTLRSDNGGEYTSKQFNEYCTTNGIRREFTIPETPEQNGVSERNWRTIMNMARAMLKGTDLARHWWGQTLATATYLKNRTLVANGNGRTPYELFYGEKPSLQNIKTFGCKVFIHNPNPRDKLDNRQQIKTTEDQQQDMYLLSEELQ